MEIAPTNMPFLDMCQSTYKEKNLMRKGCAVSSEPSVELVILLSLIVKL